MANRVVATGGMAVAGGEFTPTARYFRLKITGARASAAVRAVIRNVT